MSSTFPAPGSANSSGRTRCATADASHRRSDADDQQQHLPRLHPLRRHAQETFQAPRPEDRKQEDESADHRIREEGGADDLRDFVPLAESEAGRISEHGIPNSKVEQSVVAGYSRNQHPQSERDGTEMVQNEWGEEDADQEDRE